MQQLGATMHSLGIRFGYYDTKDWKAARYCDPIVDCWSDIVGGAAGVAFAPDAEAQAAAVEKLNMITTKFGAYCEKILSHHNGQFIAGNKMTIADFIMASYIGNFGTNPKNPAHANIQASLDSTPKLKAYFAKANTTFPFLAKRGAPASPF